MCGAKKEKEKQPNSVSSEWGGNSMSMRDRDEIENEQTGFSFLQIP